MTTKCNVIIEDGNRCGKPAIWEWYVRGIKAVTCGYHSYLHEINNPKSVRLPSGDYALTESEKTL